MPPTFKKNKKNKGDEGNNQEIFNVFNIRVQDILIPNVYFRLKLCYKKSGNLTSKVNEGKQKKTEGTFS